MRALPDKRAVIQHEDLIGILDGARCDTRNTVTFASWARMALRRRASVA